jgi:hypothetical protein
MRATTNTGWGVLALCAASLVAFACTTPVPSAPPDLQHGGGGGGGGGNGSRSSEAGTSRCSDGNHRNDMDAAALVDAQIDDSAILDAATSDDGVGCATVQCMPGFECCPFDGHCNPVTCFDCCSLFPDANIR